MSDKKYTEAPWKVEYSEGEKHVRSACGKSLMCDMTYYPWVPENDADWDLIAAAPELLESLEMFTEYFKSSNDVPVERAVIKRGSGVLNIAEFAIAKAYGTSK